MSKFNTGQSFADGDTVTGAKLNNITGLLDIYTGLISEQTAIAATVSTADQLLIADTDNGDSGAANRVTVQKLLNDTLTNGTFTDVNLTGNLNVTQLSTLGTLNNTRGTVGILNSTTGTIQSLTSSTANISQGSAIFTQGTIGTLNTTTGTIGTLNNTTGTIATLNSTTGTIATLNSTTGTITTGVIPTLTSTALITTGTGTAAAPAIVPTGDTNTGIFFPAADTIAFAEGGAEAMRIDSSGNVGIGVSSPISSLHLKHATPTSKITLEDTSTNRVGEIGGGSDGAGGLLTFSVGNNGGTITEYLRIGAIGTLTSQPTYDNTAAGSAVIVTSAGLIRRTSSSLKYKKDIENLDSSIVDNAIDKLRPVWYRTKNPEGDDKSTWSHVGLIAEEVDSVEPRLVRYKTVEVSTNENGERIQTQLENPIPEDVDYAKLSVILLSELKNQKERISLLESRILSLESA